MALVFKAFHKRLSGDAERQERQSGLKLHLGHEDRKKLHEFEEKCVEAYFYEKKEDLSNQTNTIRTTAERAEEMCMMVGDVSDKVDFIQHSLSDLDVQLGRLQDLSALAVDTLTLLSASDSLHQEEARLSQCQSLTPSCHVVPHSWTLPQRKEADLLYLKSCKSTPPSLLKGCNNMVSRRASEECHGVMRGCRGGKGQVAANEESPHAPLFYLGSRRESLDYFKDQISHDSCEPSLCGSPHSPSFGDKGFESPHYKLWSQDTNACPKEEEVSVEEEEEQEKETQNSSGTSSKVVLVLDPKDIAGCLDDSQPKPQSRPSSQWKCPAKCSRWSRLSRDRPYEYCRSLSSSVENITFSGKPPRRSSQFFNESMIKASLSSGNKFRDNTLLQSTRSREWSKSSDLTEVTDGKETWQNKKTVKIKETHPNSESVQSHLSDACWKRRRRLKGEPTCWSASTSLSQLNLEPLDLLQRQMLSFQELWSPTHSAWNSWAISASHRSCVQNVIANEVRTSSFQSSDNRYPHFSAMERNNLMRLAHGIPFTPVSIMGGEEVSIYSLVEVPSETGSATVSSWSSQGLSAVLQPVASEKGSLDGGLCQGCRVLCTWAERDVLRPGQMYVVKAFRPEVVRAWQKFFHGSTALQLCLREIQQQRAAQKMMEIFNQIKPEGMHYSPQFLDVSLVLWHSNGQWLTIERNIPGDFRKYNHNTGEEIKPCCLLEELLLAFSHWTYEYTHSEMLVLDLQGVGEELTDPTVIMADNHSGGRDEMLFGPDNLGETAINSFLQKHSCNTCCCQLGLTDLRRHKSNQENSDEESTSEIKNKSANL